MAVEIVPGMPIAEGRLEDEIQVVHTEDVVVDAAADHIETVEQDG